MCYDGGMHHENTHILLRDSYSEYPDDIVSILLDAADMSQDAAMIALFRKAASTIDDLRNGYGG